MPFLASEECFWPLTASMNFEVKKNYTYVITQYFCNKFIEVNFCVDVWFHSLVLITLTLLRFAYLFIIVVYYQNPELRIYKYRFRYSGQICTFKFECLDLKFPT